jgi:hypothetical protein
VQLLPSKRRKAKQQKKPRRVIVLFVADTHAGNRLGLMNPDVVLFRQDEYAELVEWSPPLGALQSKLWHWFVEDVGKAADLAGNDEVVYIHQGDVVQGTKHRALQVGDREANQLLIAVANQAPILSLPNVARARFVAGTAAHDGIGASRVVEVVQVLKAQYPAVNFKTLYHGVLDIDGCHIDYAHHGPHPGSRYWLAGNSLLWYVRDLVTQELVRRRAAPRVFTRAHQHSWRHVVYCSTQDGTECQHDGVLLPSWCGMQDFARKVTRSAMTQTFGMVALEVVGGELAAVHPFIHELDLRTEEVL